MSTKQKINVGVIGIGAMAIHHLDVLKSFSDVKIAALCNRSPERRNAAAARYDVSQTYADYRQMLDETELDAVFVTVNALNLVEVATGCLERGYDALIEKPPGLRSAETWKLAEIAEQNCCKAMIGLNRRFYSVVRHAQKAIDEAGPLIAITVEAPERITQAKALNHHPPGIIANWIFANGVHCLDLLRFLGGEITQIHTISHRWVEKTGDSFGALIEFESGAMGHYISHWQTPGRWRVDLYGQDIRVYLEPLEEGYILQRNVEPIPIEIDEVDRQFKAGVHAQNRYFIDCVKENKIPERPAATLEDAAKTMELIETIRRM